jgi:hypothetical protein
VQKKGEWAGFETESARVLAREPISLEHVGGIQAGSRAGTPEILHYLACIFLCFSSAVFRCSL